MSLGRTLWFHCTHHHHHHYYRCSTITTSTITITTIITTTTITITVTTTTRQKEQLYLDLLHKMGDRISVSKVGREALCMPSVMALVDNDSHPPLGPISLRSTVHICDISTIT